MYSVVLIYTFTASSTSPLFNTIEANPKLALSTHSMSTLLSYICCYGCTLILYCENVFSMHRNAGSFACNVYSIGTTFTLLATSNTFVQGQVCTESKEAPSFENVSLEVEGGNHFPVVAGRSYYQQHENHLVQQHFHNA